MTFNAEHTKTTVKRPSVAAALRRYAARFDDGEVARWAFRGLLVGAIGVLALDLRELAAVEDRAAALEMPAGDEMILPPAVRDDGAAGETRDPRDEVTSDGHALRQPMAFALRPGGVLSASGTIDVGASQRFAAEIAERGEYVKTVSLDSPGGSLEDALAMALLVRERGMETEVADGTICASSCPLILSGGVKRTIGDKAAVGLHQFYAGDMAEIGAPQAMSDAQMTTARITRHLSAMGVDPALWLHALETPPRRLYYLSVEEMTRYRLSGESPVADATPES